MRTYKRLRRIGNSLGLLIPRDVIEFLEWQPDDNISLTFNDIDKSLLLERIPLPGAPKPPRIFGKIFRRTND